MSVPSILIIGSTGRTGVQLIRSAATLSPRPTVHAFARTPSKLTSADTALCASVVQGDARSSTDVAAALRQTGATHVVIAIGEGDSMARTDIREVSAKAVMDAVAPGAEFDSVRVAAVSSTGAGGTRIQIGFGVGLVVAHMLRHVMHDHNLQEQQLVDRMGNDVASRLIVVRPTGLTDGKAKGLDHVVLFDKDTRAPSSHIDREDVALWLVSELCSGKPRFGSFYSLTSK